MGKFSIFLISLGLVALSIKGLQSYIINRDITGWKTRAQVSSEPNDMHDYMSRVQSGMKEYRMTSGYAAIIFYHS